MYKTMAVAALLSAFGFANISSNGSSVESGFTRPAHESELSSRSTRSPAVEFAAAPFFDQCDDLRASVAAACSAFDDAKSDYAAAQAAHQTAKAETRNAEIELRRATNDLADAEEALTECDSPADCTNAQIVRDLALAAVVVKTRALNKAKSDEAAAKANEAAKKAALAAAAAAKNAAIAACQLECDDCDCP